MLSGGQYHNTNPHNECTTKYIIHCLCERLVYVLHTCSAVSWRLALDVNIGICYFSAKHAALRSNSKYRLVCLGISMMCPIGATCLPTDCFYS